MTTTPTNEVFDLDRAEEEADAYNRMAALADPHVPMTQAPPLPETLANLYTTDGKYPDDNKITALSRDELAERFHDARRYTAAAHLAFNEEIEWLQAALRVMQSAQRDTEMATFVLENEWRRRRMPETITWQGVRKALKDGGLMLAAEHRYDRERQAAKGLLTFDTHKHSDSHISVTIHHGGTVALDKAQHVLEAAGYTIKHRTDKDTANHIWQDSLTVIKLRQGQTLEDVNQPYSPPQTTELAND